MPYLKKIPPPCLICGSKDFVTEPCMTEIYPIKVGSRTSGHPVDTFQKYFPLPWNLPSIFLQKRDRLATSLDPLSNCLSPRPSPRPVHMARFKVWRTEPLLMTFEPLEFSEWMNHQSDSNHYIHA